MKTITILNEKLDAMRSMLGSGRLRGALTIASVLAFTACGGGGQADTALIPVVAQANSMAVLEGQVVASDDSSVVANAKLTVGTTSVMTTADGKFNLSNLAPAARVLLKIEADGFVDGFVSQAALAGQSVRVEARLQRASAPSIIDPTKSVTVTASASSAQLVLSANSLVNEASGAIPSGNITARVTAINPASDPQTMPGDYSVSDTIRIESFGAVKISLRDAEGKKLNLKTGSTATIRIPLASRSLNPPANIPLFYFDENTGRWVEEGSAALLGTAPNQYYEGKVAHFSFWNADQIQNTIYVNGCLVDTAGKPISGALVQTEGLDYSGLANAYSDVTAKFRVAIQKGGRAVLRAELFGAKGAVLVGPSLTDINLSSCLPISDAAALPVLLEQPKSLSIAPGWPATFFVLAVGSGPIKYQWRRNGVNINGANSERYTTKLNNVDENGAKYTVLVSNAVASVTSSEATLTVSAVNPISTDDKLKLIRILGLSSDFYMAASLPGRVTKDDGSAFLNPTTVCESGSILATFNGAALPLAGTALPNNGTLSASANACKLATSTYTGSSSVTYNIVPGNTKSGTASAIVNNMTVRTVSGVDGSLDKFFTANGGGVSNVKESVLGLDTTTEATWTPDAGATIRSEISGLTATYVSGSSVILMVTQPQANLPFPKTMRMRAGYNDLIFSVAGLTYLANGYYDLKFGTQAGSPYTGSGEISLKANGVLIGRIFATNTGIYIDVDGVIKDF